MPGFIRVRARQVAMVLAAVLSAVAVAPVLAFAHALSFHARAHAAALPKAAYVLGGITSQGAPVAVSVSPGARSVDARIALVMKCTSGTVVFLDRTGPLSVSRRGAAHASVIIPPDPGNQFLGGSDTFSGQMNPARSRLAGHWHLQVMFAKSGGGTETCDSGAVAFTAS